MTVSVGGTRPDSAAEDRPIRVLISVTSTAPSRSPKMCTRPEVGNICPDAICSNVVLPAPFGPRITQRSSTSTFQFTASSSTAGPRRTVTSVRCSTESGPGSIDGFCLGAATGVFAAVGLEVTRLIVSYSHRAGFGPLTRLCVSYPLLVGSDAVGENQPMPSRAPTSADQQISAVDRATDNLVDGTTLKPAKKKSKTKRRS